METIAQPIDFIGINYYSESPVSADKKARFKFVTKPFWQDTTDTGWPLTPGGLYRQLKWISEISRGAFSKANGKAAGTDIPIYITENGYARKDEIEADGRVHDKERIEYLKQHLSVCSELIKAGMNIKGYFVWSIIDNFEWAKGYTKRFGIVHVDFFTQKRTPKDSAWFFRDVIAGFGEW
jgi:beta-glucosidase